MVSFNVLSEPWIPVAALNGLRTEVSLLDLLAEAHTFREVVEPAPPLRFGVYRLLTAFLIDALKLSDPEQLGDLIAEQRAPMRTIEEYVAGVGRKRFDLFDPETPFLQCPTIDAEDIRTVSVIHLMQHLPSGSFPVHFHHSRATQEAFAPGVCTRGLASMAPFMTAGGRGYSPSVNGNPPWYVLLVGRNLLETLILNCLALPVPGLDGGGMPSWRSTQAVIGRSETTCRSLLEGLTWRPRQVRLLPTEGGTCTYSGHESPVLVSEMQFTYGLKASPGVWIDPQVSYRVTDKGPSPLRPREDREPWRDTAPLMLLRRQDYESEDGKVRFERPLIIEQFRLLKKQRMIPQDLPEIVEVCGIRTDGKMKIFEWYHTRLSLPLGLGSVPWAGRQVQLALDLSENVAYGLGRALKAAYPRAAASQPQAFDTLIQSAQRSFWAALRPRFEERFILPLSEAAAADDMAALDGIRAGWAQELRETGEATLENAISPLDANADSLRRQVAARERFRKTLLVLADPATRRTTKNRQRRGSEG